MKISVYIQTEVTKVTEVTMMCIFLRLKEFFLSSNRLKKVTLGLQRLQENHAN